jgi:hypothetical protein
LTAQGRLLVPADEGGYGDTENGGVQRQDRLARHKRLPDDDRGDGEGTWIPHVPVEPSTTKRSVGRPAGVAQDFNDEAHEACNKTTTPPTRNHAGHLKRDPRIALLPASP